MVRILSLIVTALVSMAPVAQAQLVVCNKTSAPLELAVARETDEDVVSQGWWTIDPTKCETAVTGELDRRYYYHYARSKALNVEWGSTFNFCVKDDPQFRIVGSTECEQRGMRSIGFRQTDVIGNKLYVLDITMGPAPQAQVTETPATTAATVIDDVRSNGFESAPPVDGRVTTGEVSAVSGSAARSSSAAASPPPAETLPAETPPATAP